MNQNQPDIDLGIQKSTRRKVRSWTCSADIELIMSVYLDARIATFDIRNQPYTSCQLNFGHDVVVLHVSAEFNANTPPIRIRATIEGRVGSDDT
jgi:hypothetical protein